MSEVHPVLERMLGGYFVAQISVALAVELAGIPWRALPMRFNFPNDRIADRRYAAELDRVVLIHYLRHELFDRHRIFGQRASFDQFMSMTLEEVTASSRNASRRSRAAATRLVAPRARQRE